MDNDFGHKKRRGEGGSKERRRDLDGERFDGRKARNERIFALIG